jgi:amino acid transporter
VAACGDKNAAIIIDPIALGAIILLTVIMVFGVKESFWFNALTVAVSVLAILLCIFLGECVCWVLAWPFVNVTRVCSA